MRLKTFHAASMNEAMALVRDALGDDAIIVATAEDEAGVNLTAAIEEDVFEPLPSLFREPEPPPLDIAYTVAEALFRHGVPPELSEPLLDNVAGLDTDDPLLALGMALDAVFTFQPLGAGRAMAPVMLVGPPGSGKTVTVAKLAARAVIRNRPVRVITTDTGRAGGVDQLAAYMRQLDVSLTDVTEPTELIEALAEAQSGEEIIVDTGGRNHFEDEEMGELRRLVAASDVEPILVLPAGLDVLEAAEVAEAFRSVGSRRLLVTRLDTVRRLGSVLSVAHQVGLTFCDVGVTPRVADGLSPLSAVSLARLLMPEWAPSSRSPRSWD